VNKIGFTPLECLIQATKNNSEILCIDDKVGTVAAGKQADLIVIDGRPDEDIEDITKVDAVFKKGMLVRV
jgi:imidazolonepropionase-like amidohydrolase